MTCSNKIFYEKINNNICILGLGYVGLTLSATLADLGFRVIGVEIREKILQDLKKKTTFL